jgi:hypothetical protein
MNRRATAAAAVAAALVVLAPSSVAAVTEVDGSSINIHAPKTAKPGKKFDFTVNMAFDAADVPAYGYLKAGEWQHRGDDACPKAVPMKSSGEDKSGWKNIDTYDYYPDVDGDNYLLQWDTHLKRKAGTYRWCGYVYTIQSDGAMPVPGQIYTTVDRDQAKTIVKN